MSVYGELEATLNQTTDAVDSLVSTAVAVVDTAAAGLAPAVAASVDVAEAIVSAPFKGVGKLLSLTPGIRQEKSL